MRSNGQEFEEIDVVGVPHAETTDAQEYFEQEVEGGLLRLKADRWENRTAQTVVMKIEVSGPRANPMWRQHMPADPVSNRQYFRPQRLNVVVRPGTSVLIPRAYRRGVQTTRCRETQCSMRQLDCANEEHDHEVVGGLGPQLARVGGRPTQLARTLDPALPTVAPESIDDRLMMRAKGGLQ